MSAIDNWVLLDSYEDREEAAQVLAQAKEARKNKQCIVVRISHNTWKEIEINQIPKSYEAKHTRTPAKRHHYRTH